MLRSDPGFDARPQGGAGAPEDRVGTRSIEAVGIVSRFGSTTVLADVDLSVRAGEIHALLGPNGAGKTTLLRVLVGALMPSEGYVRIAGTRPDLLDPRGKRNLGMVPAGDRSFYLRISGCENLVFFARMQGLRRREAIRRARECLTDVGLGAAGDQRVGLYSQGMKKRLSVARALLLEVPVLVLDEATHDVDAEGAGRIRELVSRRADEGAAVVWATQRLDEVRGFAHAVTVLDRGHVAFHGTVSGLVETTTTQRFLVRLGPPDPVLLDPSRLRALVGDRGTVEPTTDLVHVDLGLRDGVVLGDVLRALTDAGIAVVSCSERQSVVEAAMRALTGRAASVPAALEPSSSAPR